MGSWAIYLLSDVLLQFRKEYLNHGLHDFIRHLLQGIQIVLHVLLKLAAFVSWFFLKTWWFFFQLFVWFGHEFFFLLYLLEFLLEFFDESLFLLEISFKLINVWTAHHLEEIVHCPIDTYNICLINRLKLIFLLFIKVGYSPIVRSRNQENELIQQDRSLSKAMVLSVYSPFLNFTAND